ncbi:unnamed protein product, partial [Polarella glacialis]
VAPPPKPRRAPDQEVPPPRARAKAAPKAPPTAGYPSPKAPPAAPVPPQPVAASIPEPTVRVRPTAPTRPKAVSRSPPAAPKAVASSSPPSAKASGVANALLFAPSVSEAHYSRAASSTQPAAPSQWKPDWNPDLEQFRMRRTYTDKNTKNYDKFWVSANDVHFTHNYISDHFQPITLKDGTKIHNKKILDNVEDFAAATGIPTELEQIDVVWKKDRWFVAGTFNRRLCMYRLLTLFVPEKFPKIQLRRVPHESVKWEYFGRHKYSTECRGVWVQVGGQHSNKYVDKTDEKLQWPDAAAVGRKIRSNRLISLAS